MSLEPVPRSEIRAAFSAAMSAMYRDEVPAYGSLLDLVKRVNDEALAGRPDLKERIEETDNLDRISEERHGAIRLGTAGHGRHSLPVPTSSVSKRTSEPGFSMNHYAGIERASLDACIAELAKRVAAE